jgi:glycosyltransferase involved in cell wall biosynthesis
MKTMLSIMVPAMNEERNIANTLWNIVNAARSTGLAEYEIIVVNDGSTDRTEEIVQELKKDWPFLKMITHAAPIGVGYSYYEALEQAKYPKFTCFAGDNNAHWSLITAMFQNMNKADIVTTYFINTEARKRIRNLVSTLFSTIYVTTFDLHVKYINGNTIYPVEMLKQIHPRSTRYSFAAEINTKLLRQNVTFYEVAGWSNPDPEANRSKAIRFSSLWDVVRCYLRLVVEVYITHRSKYAARARRVGMPKLDEVQPERDKPSAPITTPRSTDRSLQNIF